jgi:protein-L-isoaspartate(D-aspartate) O-methyltransferase
VLQSSDMVTDTDETRALRDNLLRRLVDDGELRTQRVVAAMREVPRHLFCRDGDLELAYANHPVEIGHGQTISQPAIVAMMTEALELRGDERVLEIGTGSGYQAAVLSRLCARVYSIERIATLADEARRRLLALGYDNVEVRVGDGYAGWPEQAPFDRVIVTAAPPAIPRALVEQLAEGGILVAPVGGDADTDRQTLLRATKRRRDGELVLEDLGGVRFVTMLRGTMQA